MTSLVVNKCIKYEEKFSGESASEYYDTLWCFTKFSFHHKWNDGDYYLETWYIRVSPRVAKLIKT